MASDLEIVALRVVRGTALVVDGVQFAARAGRILSVLGPNGAGKSSVVKAIAGILPYEGTISIGGADARSLDRAARARRVAYVPQQSELRSALLVADVVAQGRYAHGIGQIRGTDVDRARIARALNLAQASELSARTFTTLSQGEKQRVLLARALATDAKILVLDEPTAALDVGHALRLYELLRTLAREGYAIVTVLHPLAEALRWSDDAVLLDRGRVVAMGETPKVIRAGVMEQIYGVRLVPNGALGFRLPTQKEEGGAS